MENGSELIALLEATEAGVGDVAVVVLIFDWRRSMMLEIVTSAGCETDEGAPRSRTCRSPLMVTTLPRRIPNQNARTMSTRLSTPPPVTPPATADGESLHWEAP
jgi:hypothetical protein